MPNIKHSDMHAYNRSRVLNIIRKESGISRADIAKHIGLSMPSISAIVSSLVNEGLIVETGEGESQGGRKPIMLKFEDDARVIIAIEVRQGYVRGMCCNLNAEPINICKVTYDEDLAIEKKLEISADLIQKLLDTVEDKNKILGIGIAVIGLIDSKKRIIRYSAPLNCKNVHLDQYFGKFSMYPIHVNNISQCETLAEKWFGQGKDFLDFIFIYAGLGIGAGMISGGNLYNQTQLSAMEIGHNTVHADGEQCRCGMKGCLEAYSALWSIKKQYAELLENPKLSDEFVLEAISKRDPLLKPIVDKALYYLGIEIANLTNIFNPEIVIIDGWLHALGQEALDYLIELVKERAVDGLTDRFSILLSSLTHKGVLIGAATLVLESLFQPLKNKELFQV